MPLRSVLQTEKECWAFRELADMNVVTGLQRHHCFMGPLRDISEKEGFWVWLTQLNHTGNNPAENPLGIRGVHFNRELDLTLKMACQKAYEEHHSREQWMKLIGRNYLQEGQ